MRRSSQLPSLSSGGSFANCPAARALWRRFTGAITDWLGTNSGGFIANQINASGQVPSDWQVAGTGDFNGDGFDDILWRNISGEVTNWLGTEVPNYWIIQPKP
jgi:hypothetical protein